MNCNRDSFINIARCTFPLYFLYLFGSIFVLAGLISPDTGRRVFNEVESFKCNVDSYDIYRSYIGSVYASIEFSLYNCTIVEGMDKYTVRFDGLDNDKEIEEYSQDKIDNGFTFYLYRPGDFISTNGDYINSRKQTIIFIVVSNVIAIVFYSVIDKYRAKKEEYVNMESNVKVSDV